MWNSVPFLSAVAWWSLVITAVSGGVAVIAGLIGGIAASRSADIKGVEDAKKIATANAQAEAARLEAAQIWQQMAWRRVTSEQRQGIVTSLRGQNFEVWVEFVSADPEATTFREDLASALSEAGLDVHYYGGWERAAGLQLIGLPSPQRAALQKVLLSVDIPHTVRSEPSRQPGSQVMLLVGTKPDPTV
ncbi:MAG: hypothetical protein CL555_05875 [Algoriphagus sp.]|nr:hypothetical protein [Algoriphagus sp.]QDP64445.1 MAG: hypothetical protein Tp156MES38741_36 [Prokaryotic dsDNA virus sp.]|tara:strand:+ start:23501 stop:24067 length:567 start_codon:yes stop_codon:yes gene_type:complete